MVSAPSLNHKVPRRWCEILRILRGANETFSFEQLADELNVTDPSVIREDCDAMCFRGWMRNYETDSSRTPQYGIWAEGWRVFEFLDEIVKAKRASSLQRAKAQEAAVGGDLYEISKHWRKAGPDEEKTAQ